MSDFSWVAVEVGVFKQPSEHIASRNVIGFDSGVSRKPQFVGAFPPHRKLRKGKKNSTVH